MPRHKISYYNSPLVYSFYILDDKLAFRIIITFLCPFLPQCECGSDIQPAKKRKRKHCKKVYTILLLLLLQLRLLRTFHSIFPTTFHSKIGVDRTRWNNIYSYIQLERICTLDALNGTNCICYLERINVWYKWKLTLAPYIVIWFITIFESSRSMKIEHNENDDRCL